MTREEILTELDKYDVRDLDPDIYSSLALERVLRFCQAMEGIDGITYITDERGPEKIEAGCDADPVDFSIENYQCDTYCEPEIKFLVRHSGNIEVHSWGPTASVYLSADTSEVYSPEIVFDEKFEDWVSTQVYTAREIF